MINGYGDDVAEEITPEQMKQIEQLKKMVMNKILSKEALERLGRIRLVKPQLAAQLELYLIQLFQGGGLKGQISDDQLKNILENISSKKEYKIIK
jgi:programmed cell death protein 5